MDDQRHAAIEQARHAMRGALIDWAKAQHDGKASAGSRSGAGSAVTGQGPAPTARKSGQAGAGSAAAPERGAPELGSAARGAAGSEGEEGAGRGTPAGQRAEAGQ